MSGLVKAKVVIEDGTEVECWYNPKDITVDKKASYSKHKNSESDAPILEFTAGEPRTMNLELVFDTFESKEDVYATHVKKLKKLTTLMSESEPRPPTCRLVWGQFRFFQCVVTSMQVKYSMFLSDGTPVRATVTMAMQEATSVEIATTSGSGSTEEGGATDNASMTRDSAEEAQVDDIRGETP